MATTAKLILNFADANDNDIFFVYDYAYGEVSSSTVKQAMNTIIANGSIFLSVPVSIKTAKIVASEETEFDLYD